MAYQYRGTIRDVTEPQPEPAKSRPKSKPGPKPRPGIFDPAKCGTYAGYKQHGAYGIEACQPCKDANAASSRSYEARLKAGGVRRHGRGFQPDACGTRAGYCRHQRHKVPACGPCAEASRIYTAEHRAKKRKEAEDNGMVQSG